MKQIEVLEILETISSSQWGIITTSQAQREGVSRLQLSRLAEKGVLQRPRRGVYLLPSAQYSSSLDLRIAWVVLGGGEFPNERFGAKDTVVTSHESAALLHEIGDLIPACLTFSASKRIQTRHDDIHVYNNRKFAVEDVAEVNGLPTTSVARTVEDLAENRIEFNYLATIVVEALRKEGVKINDLVQRLDGAASAYGFDDGQELVQACLAEAASATDVEEAHTRAHMVIGAELAKAFAGQVPPIKFDRLLGEVSPINVRLLENFKTLHVEPPKLDSRQLEIVQKLLADNPAFRLPLGLAKTRAKNESQSDRGDQY